MKKSKYLENLKSYYKDNLVEVLKNFKTHKDLLKFKCSKCNIIFLNSPFKLKSRQKQYSGYFCECDSCVKTIRQNKVNKTNIKNFGYKAPAQNKDIKAKIKETNIAKYGGNSPSSCKEIVFKIKKTNLEKYGSLNAQGNPVVQEKTKVKNTQKYGASHIMKTTEGVNRQKKALFDKYGSDNPMKIKKFLNKNLKSKGQPIKKESFKKIVELLENDPSIIISSKEFQKQVEVNYVTIFKWLREENRDDLIKGHNFSSAEKSLVKELSNLNLEFEENKRGLFSNKKLEVDLWFPSKKVAVEYNGLFWHSELKKTKKSHFNKRVLAEKESITLIQIYEDEWLYKKDIVLSLIKTKLGIISEKINARDCKIKKINKKVADAFLNENHLMGPAHSYSSFGLFKNEKLFSLIAVKNTKQGLDISRFCNLKNTIVRGGFSKLLNHVIKEYKCKTVVSFVDLRYADGNSLIKQGFILKGITQGFEWTDFLIRYNRRFIKATDTKTQLQVASDKKLVRIFDAGQAKFIKYL